MKTAKSLVKAGVWVGSRSKNRQALSGDRERGSGGPCAFSRLWLCSPCAPQLGMAQVPTGSIAGTVLDAQRLPIVDATVTLKN